MNAASRRAAFGSGIKTRSTRASSCDGLAFLFSADIGCTDLEEARTLYFAGEKVRASFTGAIRKGVLIAYRKNDGRYLVPRWQFRPEGGVLEGLPRVLAALRCSGSYTQLSPFVFFLQPNPLTSGALPLSALRAGRIDQVVRAAEAEWIPLAPGK